MQPKIRAASSEAEDAADQLVEEARLLEQRLRLVEPLDHDRERDRRREEHRGEPDHPGVLGRELRPVAREVVAERFGDVRREEEREQDRGDADQAPDRALGEAEHEERHEEQEDEQVDPFDPAQKALDVHQRSFSASEPRPGPGRRKGSSGHRESQEDSNPIGAVRMGPVRSGSIRCGSVHSGRRSGRRRWRPRSRPPRPP